MKRSQLKNKKFCSTNYFIVAKFLKHNENKPCGYQIRVNKTKCMEVRSGIASEWTEVQSRTFFLRAKSRTARSTFGYQATLLV